VEVSDHLVSKDTSKEFVSAVSGREFFSKLVFQDQVGDMKGVKME
jgi:hypothetical protein